MKQRLRNLWSVFSVIAILFSFLVNCILVAVLIGGVYPLLQLKNNFLEPLLTDLDLAFQGLGTTTINTTVEVDQTIPISFTLPMSQPLDLDFQLPIEQDTSVVLTQPTRIENVAITFVLPAGGGVINGSGSIVLPANTVLPVHLNMVVPVRRTIPVVMDVPVDQTIPIQMAIPVSIQLGEAGLDPAVQELRAVFTPLNDFVQSLPDGIEFR